MIDRSDLVVMGRVGQDEIEPPELYAQIGPWGGERVQVTLPDTEPMDRKVLAFIALAISMLYGVGFAVIDDPTPYAPIGGVIVALAWIAVGVFGRDRPDSST